MVMPCARANSPSPHEYRKLPSRSNTATGCSPRLKTNTRSRESVATAATSSHVKLAGRRNQSACGSNKNGDSPTLTFVGLEVDIESPVYGLVTGVNSDDSRE